MQGAAGKEQSASTGTRAAVRPEAAEGAAGPTARGRDRAGVAPTLLLKEDNNRLLDLQLERSICTN